MLAHKVALGAAAAVLLAAAACNVKNVEVHGSYRDAGIREKAHPLAAEMFNLAFKAAELPAGSVSSGEYVAAYRLSSGKAEDQWWCYFAEDWIVDKVRAAGATPVERNTLAARLLEAEAAYAEPPAGTSLAAVSAPSPAGFGKKEAERTPYRATRALAYRVVAADLWFDQFNPHGRGHEAAVRANAQVTVNLRTLDVGTGEVLWSGSTTGTARKAVNISRLTGWLGIHDWEDWDDWPFRWHWDWDAAPAAVAEPAEDAPQEEAEQEDVSAEAEETSLTAP